MDKEILKQIEQSGMIKASVEMMYAVFNVGVSFEEFVELFNDKNSEVAKAYQKGIYQYDFKVQTELAKKAMQGDLISKKELDLILVKNKIKK